METYKASDFAKAGVFPRRVSAEGPLASLGATKSSLGGDTWGLAQIFKTASTPLDFLDIQYKK